MICVSNMPCKDCKSFNGFSQRDGTEKTEYVKCDKAPDGHANTLLNEKMCCKEYAKEDD